MRNLLLLATSLLIATLAACGPSAAASGEAAVTPDARAALIVLRAEAKFRPQILSGYTGADTPEDVAPLTAAVNTLIDEVLERPDGPVSEAEILPLVTDAVEQVDLFATEDRERAYRYFKQVWSILGLRGDPVSQSP